MTEPWPYQNLDPANPQFTPPLASPTEGVLYQIAISEEWKWILTTLVNRIVDPGAWDAEKEDQEQASLYAVELSRLLWEAAVIDCNEVGDCIENDVNVQNQIEIVIEQTINNYNNPMPQTPGYPMTETELTNPLIPAAELAGCDNDALWGASLYLVEQFSIRIDQFFEELELATNLVEFVELLLDAVNVPFNFLEAVLDLMNFMQELGDETWAVANSPTNQEWLACIIFCEFKENCKPTLENLLLAIYTEWESLTGFNLTNVVNFVEFVIALPGQSEWANKVMFLGMFIWVIGGARWLQWVPFFNPGEPTRWISQRLKVGYSNPQSGWELICDDCPTELPCGFYVVNFLTLGTSGLPTGWQADPPANMASAPGFSYFVWANERGANQTLRGANFPSYGQVNEGFVNLCAAYDLSEDCTLLNLTTDFNYASTPNTKQVSAYGLPASYDWEDRVFIDSDSTPLGSSSEPGIDWSGNIEGIRYIVLTSNGVYSAGDGSVSLRFFRVNQA